MRSTLRRRKELLKRARDRAAAARRALPVSRATGGILPGVDLRHSRDLEDLMNAT
jgi:hypothetical protein